MPLVIGPLVEVTLVLVSFFGLIGVKDFLNIFA
jgi:hypothetical protein